MKPQTKAVLEYLRAGRSLTNLIALHQGIGSLTSRIAELRRAGYQITSSSAKDLDGKRYVKYRLVEKA